MSLFARGLTLALLHVLLVGSLGAKLLFDRRTLPKVWVETAPYDPDLPIRGRYVQLRLVVRADRVLAAESEEDRRKYRFFTHPARLVVEGDALVALPEKDGEGLDLQIGPDTDPARALLDEPVAFFIPEKVADPSRREKGEELWVEVTVPRQGPPRPIRLGVRKDGQLTPLDLR